MKTRELTLALIIVGYLGGVFTFLVIEQEIEFQNYTPQPIKMVELFGNGSVRNFEVENPSPPPNLFTSILMAFGKLSFALPFAVAGIGLVGAPIGFLQTHLFVPPEGLRVLIFWIVAMISIPINYFFTKGISLWYRIPYIYLVGAIISGTPMMLNENFEG